MFVPDCGGDGGDVAAVGADRARAAGAEAALARRRGDLERDRVDAMTIVRSNLQNMHQAHRQQMSGCQAASVKALFILGLLLNLL